jgi:hypothetical protein
VSGVAVTRLYYHRSYLQPGVLLSDYVMVGTHFHYVSITPASLTFEVIKVTENSTIVSVYQGNAKTLNGVKRKAKKVLKELGANFKDEIRNSGKTERFDV